MKTILSSVIFLLVIHTLSYPQDLNVPQCINKSKSEVIKKYGKPVHQDNSNPAMICMFYKSNSGSMIFVSDNEGIYQAESAVIYNKEQDARAALDKFITESVSKNFSVDSVTTSDFHLQKTGVKVDLQIFENKLSKKFEIKVKAHRSSY
jgi:hypothetical protein